jgi:multiple sugar transport system substrate-binding protein
MKNKKKLLFGVLSTVMATSVLLSGCGSSSTSAPSKSKSSDSSSKGPVTLKVLSATVVEKPDGDTEQQIANDFMKTHPNIKIEFIGVPMNEVYAKITTLATGGDMPDVFTNSPEFYAKANELGITADLNPILGKDYVKGFYPVTTEQAKLDGKLQFAPFFTIPTGLLYRKDWFEQAGLQPPKTWDEFEVDAKALTKDGHYGFAMVGSKDGSGGSRFIPIMHTFGAQELVDKNGKYSTQFDSKGAIAAFKLYGDLVNKDKAVPPGPLETSYAQAVSLIANEKAAMMVTGPHTIGAVLKQNPNLKGKLAGVPLPTAPGQKSSSALGMLGFSIYSKSTHQKEAAEYLKYLLNKENQLKWNEVTGRIPSRMDAGEDPKVKTPETQGFIDAMKYAFKMPTVAYYAKLQVIAGEGYQAVITNTATPEDAAKKAAQETQTEIQNAQ